LSILVALLAPGLATAATRPAGAVPDAQALRHAGLAVTWPLHASTTTAAPGTRLTVTVRRLRAGAPRATVELLRVARSGRVLERIAARRLRSGHARFTVPAGTSTHWALHLQAGRLAYTSWIDPPPGMPDPCPSSGTPAATLTLAAPTLPAGGSIGYTLRDTGTWADVPSTKSFITIAYILRPGTAYSGTATPEPSMTPGHYRLVVGYTPSPVTAPVVSEPVATAEVDVA
jgi:hypothetical protein